MSIEVDKLVMGVWDANSFNTIVAGGIWDGEAPVGTHFPYVIFSQVSDTPDVFTSGGKKNSVRGKITQVLFDLTIYVKEDGATDPKVLTENAMAPMRDAFENAIINGQFKGTNGEILLIRPYNENVRRQAEGIWRGTLTYRVREKFETTRAGFRV